MIKKLVCSECGGRMQEGFILDNVHGGALPSIWVEGQPETSFWTGLKLDKKMKSLISAYRCEKCGHMKFYAYPKNSINK